MIVNMLNTIILKVIIQSQDKHKKDSYKKTSSTYILFFIYTTSFFLIES